MRFEPAPARQKENNEKVSRRGRWLQISIIVLFLFTVSSAIHLYLRGNQFTEHPPQVVLADGSSVVGPAVIVASSLALCAFDVPSGALLICSGEDPIPVTVIRRDSVTTATQLILLKLGRSLRVENVPSIGSAVTGQKVRAFTASEQWEGVLNSRTDGSLLDPMPSLSLGYGLPVFSVDDKTLIGVTAEFQSALVVVQFTDILLKFPEIKSAIQ